MFYTLRMDYSDGTFKVVEVSAESIEAAKASVQGAEWVSVVGMRDSQHAECLAF